ESSGLRSAGAVSNPAIGSMLARPPRPGQRPPRAVAGDAIKDGSQRLSIDVVRLVVALEPSRKGCSRVHRAIPGDLSRGGRVEGEFENQAVRILDIERTAIAVLQDKGVGILVTGGFDALLNRLLCRFIDLERDVMKGRLWNGRTELLLIRSIGELEERESSAITETEEAVTVGTHLSEEFVGFAPGRHEWQSNDLLVELAGLLHVLGRVGCVMKTAGQVRCFRHPANSPISGRTPARRSRVCRRLDVSA